MTINQQAMAINKKGPGRPPKIINTLNPHQRIALEKLHAVHEKRAGAFVTSTMLSVAIGTLRALHKLNLTEMQSDCFFRISPAGIEAINAVARKHARA